MNDASVAKVKRRAWAGPLLAVAGLVALYLGLSIGVFPTGVFWSPDTACKFLQLQSLRFDGGFDHVIAYPGREIDPELKWRPFDSTFVDVGTDGVIHLVWAPWFALLSLPFFRMLGSAGLQVWPALAGAGAAVLAGLLARRIAGGRGFALAALLAGLGTPLFCYSLLFWEHTLGALLASLAVWLILRGDGWGFSWNLVGAGSALALACVLRSEVLLLGVALGVVLIGFGRWAAGVALALGFGATSAPFWLYQWRTTGHLLPVSAVNRWADMGLARVLDDPLRLVPNLLAGDNVPWGLAFPFSLAIVVVLALSWFGRGRVFRAVGFQAALWAVAVTGALLVAWMNPRRIESSSIHGALAIAPVLVVAFLRPTRSTPSAAMPSAGPAYRFLLWTTGVYAVLYAVNAVFTYNGGLEWGPRFFLPAYPLLAALAVGWWAQSAEGFRSRGWSGVGVCLVLLALLGFLAQARGAVGIYANLRRQVTVNQAVAQIADGTPLLVTSWWIPTVVIGHYQRLPMFRIESKEDLARWSGAAAARGLRSFWLVGGTPRPAPAGDPLLEPPWPSGLRLQAQAPQVCAKWLTMTHVEIGVGAVGDSGAR